MHVVINGWFINQLTAGSGQYIHYLLEQLPIQAPATRFTLLIPKGATEVGWENPWSAIEVRQLARLSHTASLENLAKLWWEQVTVPWATARLHADCLWVPYWAAPLWQPVPVVVTVHDLIPCLLPAYRGGGLQRLYTALVSRSAQRAAAVVTVSQASARDAVQHLGIPASRVHAVHNGFNLPESASSESNAFDEQTFSSVRGRYNLPPKFFLYLGGFDMRKNVRSTLAAYQRYLQQGGDPAIKLVIAGQLPAHDSTFAPDPQKISAELNLGNQVQFCGRVEEADKLAVYALATAYIFPSLYEGFGMMALEAMAAGTPVITSSTSA